MLHPNVSGTSSPLFFRLFMPFPFPGRQLHSPVHTSGMLWLWLLRRLWGPFPFLLLRRLLSPPASGFVPSCLSFRGLVLPAPFSRFGLAFCRGRRWFIPLSPSPFPSPPLLGGFIMVYPSLGASSASFFSCAAPVSYLGLFCAGVGGLFTGYRASCLPRSHPLPRADWVWALSASTCLSRLAAFFGRLSSFRGDRPCRALVCAMVVSLFPSSALCGGGYRVRLLLLVPLGSCLTRNPPPPVLVFRTSPSPPCLCY